MEQELMTFGLENLLIFGKFSDFYCITLETLRGGKGAQFSGAPNHCGGSKSHNNVISTFFKTVGCICFRKISGSNMGAPNLFLSPGAI